MRFHLCKVGLFIIIQAACASSQTTHFVTGIDQELNAQKDITEHIYQELQQEDEGRSPNLEDRPLLKAFP